MNSLHRGGFLAAWLALQGTLVLQAPTAHAQPVRIMPLGDSNTHGFNLAGGYRDPLFQLLQDASIDSQFVGDHSANATSSLTSAGQQFHSGHSGWVIDGTISPTRTGLAENIDAWLGPGGSDPDIILLMIGTNDVIDDLQLGAAPERLGDLISTMVNPTTGLRPDAHVIVASLIPNNQPDKQELTDEFNAQLPAVVSSHISMGESVSLVKMANFLTAADMADFYHPNAAGHATIGQVFFDSIVAHLNLPAHIAGDVNLDGVVNGNGQGDPTVDDVAAFRAGWRHEQPIGDANSYALGDLNQDGVTDFSDWSILRSQHQDNQQLPSNFVPEPATYLLVALAGLLALQLRTRPIHAVAPR